MVYLLHDRLSNNELEAEAVAFLEEYDRESSLRCFQSAQANWKYATNITDDNEKAKLKVSLENAAFTKEAWKNLTSKFPAWKSFKDPDLLRKFKKLTVLGTAALPDDKLKEVCTICLIALNNILCV